MARYALNDEFTKITETSGTIINISSAKVELSDTQEKKGGFILYPKKEYSFEDITLYARREAGEHCPASIAVGPLMSSGSGDEVSDDDIATDAEVDEMLDEIIT